VDVEPGLLVDVADGVARLTLNAPERPGGAWAG
jgi:hypothetical protein